MFVQQRLLADSPTHVSLFVPRHGLYRSSVKRSLDILLVLMALPVVLPLVLVMALVVLMDGGNPFYSQERVGRGGHRYRMWKLRSMVVDADKRLQGHLDINPEARADGMTLRNCATIHASRGSVVSCAKALWMSFLSFGTS